MKRIPSSMITNSIVLFTGTSRICKHSQKRGVFSQNSDFFSKLHKISSGVFSGWLSIGDGGYLKVIPLICGTLASPNERPASK